MHLLEINLLNAGKYLFKLSMILFNEANICFNSQADLLDENFLKSNIDLFN